MIPVFETKGGRFMLNDLIDSDMFLRAGNWPVKDSCSHNIFYLSILICPLQDRDSDVDKLPSILLIYYT